MQRFWVGAGLLWASLAGAVPAKLSETGLYSNIQTKEIREVSSFTKISFRVPGNLYLKQGSPQKVEMEGDKDLLQKIETEVDGDRLIIGKENHWNWGGWGDSDRINVYITVKNIEGLSVSGSGDLIGQGKFSVSDLDCVK